MTSAPGRICHSTAMMEAVGAKRVSLPHFFHERLTFTLRMSHATSWVRNDSTRTSACMCRMRGEVVHWLWLLLLSRREGETHRDLVREVRIGKSSEAFPKAKSETRRCASIHPL